MSTTRTEQCVRGGQIDWGTMRTGIMRADVVSGVPYAEILAMYPDNKEVCVLEGHKPMEFPAGSLTLVDVKLSDGEPIVTLEFTPKEEKLEKD